MTEIFQEESCSRGNQLVEEIKSNIVEVGRKLYKREVREGFNRMSIDVIDLYRYVRGEIF